MINQQMHIYKYVQSRVIILHEHVLVATVTIIRVSYKKKLLICNITLKFSMMNIMVIKHKIIILHFC